jgi:PE family
MSRWEMDMSFVTAAPDLVEAAAQDLAGIRSSLMEASASVAVPTTGVVPAAADEVSAGVAALFGNFGKEFQAVSAQAQAFHAEFVNAMNAGAAAYAGAEAAAGQTLMSAVAAPAQALLGGGAALTTGQATPALIQGIESFGATVAAPYQALVINTNNNLAAINQTFMANPFPFLNQVASNQIGFAQTFGAGLATSLQGFPANVPANIQLAIQGASTFNPAALAQQFITNQQGYAFTIGSSLQLAGQDFVAGVQTLPAGFQAAFQALLAGDNIGAYSAIDQALTNAFLPGFNVIEEPSGLLSIVPIGPLGDLAPILAIPGQMAQNFTNLLPPGSIPAQMAQNATNLVNAFTNFGTTLDLFVTGDLNFGLPLQFIFDGIGGPANALSALNSSAVAFTGAVQAGNASAAAAALLDMPAGVTNGFLNGSTLINLPPASLAALLPGIFSTVQIPLGGILTPLSIPPGFIFSPDDPGVIVPIMFGPGSTEIGGLIPGLLSFGPELAQAIGGPAPAAAAAAAAAPALAQGIQSFGAAVAAPYQALVGNTVTNLQAIGSTISANPAPFLNQLAANQIGYAQTFGAGLATSLQGFPANVPANIQLAIQGASTFNPAALAQQFIAGQIGAAQTISTSLQNAGQTLMTGAPAFQAGVQAAFQDLFAGNPIGAYSQIQQALQNYLLPGFNVAENGIVFTITPAGFLSDLAPILALPGPMAQSFTNLLPPGSILEQMAQNTTNVVNALTDFNTVFTLGSTLTFGLPVQLIFDALGGPGNALSALNSTGVAFAGAVQAGNASAAAAAILDAPANMANGFLNGQSLITLPSAEALGLQTTVSVPLGGILTPLSLPELDIEILGMQNLPPGTSLIGGLIPGLLSADSQLAQAITPTT